jgi:SAM-dependent methyltransferase
MDDADPHAAYERWHAEHPGTGRGPWYDMAAKVLTSTPRLVASARVLEIGCGSGDFAAWMVSRGAKEVTGEDFSNVAIQAARERHQANDLSFAVGDIENIAHGPESFDLVVSCETIEHVLNPARAVNELARVLRKGGTLLLSTPNYLSLTGLYRVYRDISGRKWDEGGQPLVNWTMFPRTALWVRRAGLTIRSSSGEGWYLPVAGRPGGLSLEPPARLRRWAKYAALHSLLEAEKPRQTRQSAR